jgi:hypothetical protein
VNLSGISVSQAKIGETMMRLHSFPNFQDVELHFTQKTTVKTGLAVEFEVGAIMKGDELPKGAEANGSGQS